VSIPSTEKTLDAARAEGKITAEAIAAARDRIGLHLRPEGPYLQDATLDTMRNFCNGIGDLNPIYRDAEHGRTSRFGTVIAHPMFPMAFGWLGRTRWGLPGVHGFYAGNDWELFRNVRPGDRVTAIERVVGVDEKRDELVARVLGWCTRHERKAARKAGKYKDTEKHEYTADELEAIDRAVLDEDHHIRGRDVRYWEDVDVHEELPAIARGPLSLMDTMGFLVGCGRGHTHGVLLKGAVRHPGHFFRNPEASGGVEYTGIVHHRESVAREVGVPGTYDYGPQRSAWLATLVTNWMGEAAFLKRVRTELRLFNTMGDTTWCKGRVARKYLQDGYGLVDLDVWAENQRGEVTAPNGIATVILPSRDVRSRVPRGGSGLDLGAAHYG
jgi:acyl dehydratase